MYAYSEEAESELVTDRCSNTQQTIDPIVCAAACVSSLQTVVSRSISYADPAVLSVCFLQGGETFNVIPDTCRFGGTIRDLAPAVFDKIKSCLINIGKLHHLANIISSSSVANDHVCCAVEQTCAAYGCTCEIDVESRYPVLVNTEVETGHVVRVAKRFFNVGDDLLPMLAAEVRFGKS